MNSVFFFKIDYHDFLFSGSEWHDTSVVCYGDDANCCLQRGKIIGIKNKAAIALQCKSNGKVIASLLFIPYSILIWGDYLPEKKSQNGGKIYLMINFKIHVCLGGKTQT